MNIHLEKSLGDEDVCPYLPDCRARQLFFVADEVNEEELDELLATGWRHFGPYFFRPKCRECLECVPLRIVVPRFEPSKSQRRNLRMNQDLRVEFIPPAWSDEAFSIFRRHSETKFKRTVTEEEFIREFLMESTPSLQSNYYLDDVLVAVGFIDKSANALSSVYFVYDPAFGKRGLGTLSVLAEVKQCELLGLRYYYLGYLIERCPRMAYKGRFYPHERYDWATGTWTEAVTGRKG